MTFYTDGMELLSRFAGSIAFTAVLTIGLILWLRPRKRRRSFSANMDKASAFLSLDAKERDTSLAELQEILKPLGPEAVVGEPAKIVGNVEVNVTKGWVTVKLDELMKCSPDLKNVLQDFSDTVADWGDKFGSGWFHGIHAYSRAAMVVAALRVRETMTDEDQERYSRKMTASAILYGHAVPHSLFLLDNATIEIILRFQALTQPMSVDLEKIPKWMPFLPVDHMPECIHQLLTNPILIDHLASEKRAPSLVYIRESLGLNVDLAATYTPDQLRKLITCIYLGAGLAVPRDCLYVDMDVHDYVMKTGEYEWDKTHTTTVL